MSVINTHLEQKLTRVVKKNLLQGLWLRCESMGYIWGFAERPPSGSSITYYINGPTKKPFVVARFRPSLTFDSPHLGILLDRLSTVLANNNK